LAVENTNLKAQRLSFGPAQEAADAFRDRLEAVTPAGGKPATWRVVALVKRAVAALRDSQVSQAPHIAAADDAVMTRLEQRMRAAETVAGATRSPRSSDRAWPRRLPPPTDSWPSTPRSPNCEAGIPMSVRSRCR
jgi:hypothetical protein